MPDPVPTGTDPDPGTFVPKTLCLVTTFIEDDVEFEVQEVDGGVVSIMFRVQGGSCPLGLYFRDEDALEGLTKALIDFQRRER